MPVRGEQPAIGSERELISGWLAFQRETLALKVEGLDPADLSSRPLPPSTLSLARILRHLTDMEHMDVQILTGQDPTSRYPAPTRTDATAEDPGSGIYDWSLYDVEDNALAIWREQRIATDAVVARFSSLDTPAPGQFQILTVRGILLALIMEYSRHNGHADLLRQQIDGRIGY